MPDTTGTSPSSALRAVSSKSVSTVPINVAIPFNRKPAYHAPNVASLSRLQFMCFLKEAWQYLSGELGVQQVQLRTSVSLCRVCIQGGQGCWEYEHSGQRKGQRCSSDPEESPCKALLLLASLLQHLTVITQVVPASVASYLDISLPPAGQADRSDERDAYV